VETLVVVMVAQAVLVLTFMEVVAVELVATQAMVAQALVEVTHLDQVVLVVAQAVAVLMDKAVAVAV
jgi:hypothetical protein